MPNNECIFCGKPVYAKGFCKTDYIFLFRHQLLNSDKAIQLKALENKLNRKLRVTEGSTEGCLYCGESAKARGFCTKHYLYLHRSDADFADLESCISMLKKRDETHNYVSKVCKICGKKAKSRGLCNKHYMQKYRQDTT